MDFLHSTWFWCVVAAAPFVMVVGTLARLARQEPPPVLPPGVSPGTYRRNEALDTEDQDNDPHTDAAPQPPAGQTER